MADAKATTVKAFKIDLRPYKVKVPEAETTACDKCGREIGRVVFKDGKPVMKDDDFDVKGSLCDILFNRELQLKPEDLFKAYDLSRKIRAGDSFVVLSPEEMAQLRRAYDMLKGCTENMYEFLFRIKSAPEIEVGEVAKEAVNVAEK